MILSQATHCALVILSELTLNYEIRGVSVEDISKSNYIPIDLLQPVAERLCDLEFIECKKGDDNASWIFLKRENIPVIDIVMLFDGDVFNGRFIDAQTGKLLPRGRLSYFINIERDLMLKYLCKRLRNINIRKWGEMSHSQYNIY